MNPANGNRRAPVVVAHDGTESGDRALALALQLRPPGSELVLVSVCHAPPFTFDRPGLDQIGRALCLRRATP